jgi:cytochrome P450
MVAAVPAIRRDPLAYLAGAVRRYGDLVAFPMPRTPVLLVNTVDGARRVLVDHHGAYTKQTVQYGALSLVTGAGLLTADGEAWRHRRRIDQPAFHHGRLDGVAAASVLAADRLRAAPAGQVLDVEPAALQATLEVVGRTLFGGALAAEGERVVAAVLDALDVVVARARTPVPLPRWAPTRGRLRLRRSVATLDAACADVVARRRALGVREEDGDLLALLLRAAAAGDLGEADVRDELVTMVIAGHETVASSVTWTLHLLATNPGAQRRLHAELDDVLADRPPGWRDLPALLWTRAVVEESLRLFPPAWVLTRRAVADDVVDGVAVPAGTVVIVSPWLLHRRPDVFGDPESFEPRRFLGDAARRLPRAAYLPFGAGPRICIGRDFAIVESVLLVAALLRDRTVVPAPGPAPSVDASVTLRPRGGLRLGVVPRHASRAARVPRADPPGDQARDPDDRHGDGGDPADGALDRRVRGAGDVPEQDRAGAPDQPTGEVEAEEPRVGHPRGARQGGDGGAEERDEPAEEDGGAATAREEPLRPRDALPVPPQGAGL